MSKLIKQPAPAVCFELETSEEDIHNISKLDINRMLMLLHLIREFETQLLVLKDADLVHGPVHVSIGQEAVAAAVSVALRKSDMVASTHRAHGHFLSKAVMYYAPDYFNPLNDPFSPAVQNSINKTLAEIMGLKDGWCGGRGGSMHLYDGESGNLGSNAIVGGGIPIATGAAWAQSLQKKDNVVVSYFGDGAINQGCFHEVANMATLWCVPVLYLVENNLYAVGTCTLESSCVEDLALRTLGYGFGSLIVDGMNPVSMYVAVKNAVEDMRKKPFPFLIEAKTYRYYHHGGGIAGSAFGYRTKEEEADWLSKDPLQTFPKALQTLNIITSEENDHYREMAVSAVNQAIDYCTEVKDGERLIPASKWPDPATTTRDIRYEGDVFQGVSFIEQEDMAVTKEMTYVQAISGVTLRAMERDERVIVMGEEVANLRGGAYSATRGIKEVYPERLFNTPISETGFIGMAGGLASVGLLPVVEIMFPDFALMSSDQLFNQIGKLRHMYGGQVKFPIVLRTRIAMGFGYGGQHSMDPCAVFALFSGWRIMAPSNSFDYVGMFNTAMKFQDPVLMVEHGQIYADVTLVPEDNMDYCVEYGKAKIVHPGTDLTVLTYLLSVKHCIQAAKELAEQDVSVEVIDLRTLDYTGMDYSTIGESLKKTGSVLVVEQAPRSMTLGPRISDEIQERFFDYLDNPVRKVSGLDVPPPVSKILEETALPSLDKIKNGMLKAAKRQ
jgi:2-oxoisovalerate dehydrogenase E1 component